MKLYNRLVANSITVDGEVPDEVKILPLGTVKSQKGDFLVDEESFRLIQNHFKQRHLDIVVDYEHQTLNGVQAPAAGWITDISINKEDGAILTKVNWTPKAKEYIANKEYRYMSPVVMVRKSDNKAVVLHSVALTNTPAIDGMFTIANKLNDEEGDDPMDLLEQLIKLLGLAEGADENAVIEKLKELVEMKLEGTENTDVIANKEVLKLLELKEDANMDEVTGKIMELKNPTGHVTVEQFAQLQLKLQTREADELVMAAMKDGKLTAAQKTWATEYALKAPDQFKQYLETAPQVVPMGEVAYGKETKSVNADTIMSVNKMFGLSEEDVKKYGGAE